MRTSRSSQDSRSACEISSAFRHSGGWGHPTTLCSAITRPSSRMKSRHTSPHLTSLSTPDFKPSADSKAMTCPVSGGQVAPIPAVSTEVFMMGMQAGKLPLIAFSGARSTTDNLRSLDSRSGPWVPRYYVLYQLLHHCYQGVTTAGRTGGGQSYRSSAELRNDFHLRNGLALLSQVTDPEKRNAVIGQTLYDADHRFRRAPVADRHTDQNQFNAGKYPKAERDPEFPLAPAM